MNADTRRRAARHSKAGSENCLPIGTRLSDFEITGVLGEGGFGIVYVAYDRALQRTVAIKEYMPGALAMRAGNGAVALRAERHKGTFRLGLKSFINEARLLARFDHPALIKVYRFWEHNNTAYMAMKYYDGRTIKDIVTNSPELVDEAWCRKVLRQILGALGMLYTMRILHRDISPDNIIVQENGDAVLLDFGSARQIIGDMTRGLTVILKPGYAPVEQYAGDASLEQGPYTDLYALSAVMYFAITKTPPPASIGRMITDPMVALTAQAPAGYGEPLLAAIDKGLAVLAENRPQTIEEFRKLLGFAAPEQAAPAQAPASAPAPVPEAAAPAGEASPAQAAAQLPALVPARAPARTKPAAKSPPPKSAAQSAAVPQQRRLLIGAGAAGVLAVVVAGVYALLPSSGQDTVVLAQSQASSPVAASASAPAAPQAGMAPATEPAAAAATPAVLDDATPSGPLDSVVAGVATPTPVAGAPADAASALPPGAQPKPDAQRAPVAVSYKVHIKPWGTLIVDDEARGVSPPLKQVALPPGKHRVRIVNPNFPDHVATIEVAKDKPGSIEHDFSAQ